MAALGDDLLRIVNQLQDLVFNTIGTDSLDLPQIVRHISQARRRGDIPHALNGRIGLLLPRRSPFSYTLSFISVPVIITD